ncbi:hypothetical protein [Rugamonas apoptosis]|uniref:Uncharacterized protein n=1 Tax=Rugamonas apoptosis TaxID=2758570 RepID=A0A7W2F744_9BURK|nr:hypothetical protein [Rugamonas apoptosis]MBA5686347.1 hypothetical protein [Rugamonas apoptosis]
MFKATFLFSFPSDELMEPLRFEVEAMHVRSEGRMILTFNYGRDGRKLTPMHTGWLDNYTPWCESPVALLLRALQTLKNHWYVNLRAELHVTRIEALELSIVGVDACGETDVRLGHLTLTLPRATYYDSFRLNQTVPESRSLPVRVMHAVPIDAALSALRAIQQDVMDIEEPPCASNLDVVTDSSGVRYVLREQIPSYAQAAFDAFSRRFRLASCGSIKSKALVHARDWEHFVAA